MQDRLKGLLSLVIKNNEKNSQKEKNIRFYFAISAFAASYIYILNRSRKSESEILRMGAAGSLTVLIGEGSFYFIDIVNSRSKVLAHNAPFNKMIREIVQKEGIR